MICHNVLITGASGFVGRVVGDLLVRRGHRVAAATRDPRRLLPVLRPRFVGDIGPDTEWVEALFNVDAVIHMAAHVHHADDDAETARLAHHRVNALGTRHLAEAAAASGVRRFVFVSTIKVNGESTPLRPFSELDPPAPADAYAQSKWEAERALRRIADTTGMQVVILRPPLVYGPAVKGNFRTMLDRLTRNESLPFGAVRNRRSLLYVDNLADAVVLALEHPRAGNQTYLVSDGEDISTPDLIRRIDRLAGRPSRLVSVPPWLLRTGARFGRHGAAIARLTGSLAVDDRRIRDELDWHPPVTLDEGLARTVRWHTQMLKEGPRLEP